MKAGRRSGGSGPDAGRALWPRRGRGRGGGKGRAAALTPWWRRRPGTACRASVRGTTLRGLLLGLVWMGLSWDRGVGCRRCGKVRRLPLPSHSTHPATATPPQPFTRLEAAPTPLPPNSGRRRRRRRGSTPRPPRTGPTRKVLEVDVLRVAAPEQADRLAELAVVEGAAHDVAEAAEFGQLEAAVAVGVEFCAGAHGDWGFGV
jgi:hypothetical protein